MQLVLSVAYMRAFSVSDFRSPSPGDRSEVRPFVPPSVPALEHRDTKTRMNLLVSVTQAEMDGPF